MGKPTKIHKWAKKFHIWTVQAKDKKSIFVLSMNNPNKKANIFS